MIHAIGTLAEFDPFNPDLTLDARNEMMGLGMDCGFTFSLARTGALL